MFNIDNSRHLIQSFLIVCRCIMVVFSFCESKIFRQLRYMLSCMCLAYFTRLLCHFS